MEWNMAWDIPAGIILGVIMLLLYMVVEGSDPK